MKEFKILFLGDIIGAAGVRAFVSLAASLKREFSPDIIIVNAENAADGFGLTPQIVDQLFSAGAQVISTGNHIWHHKEIFPVLEQHPYVLRPANYPAGNPGKGSCVLEVRGEKITVLNLQGRVRMWNIDCPLRKARDLVRKARQESKIIFVDMHADAPEEKEALAAYLDGTVSAVIGTHTHVQTRDERILPGGTAYLSDVGACGPSESVIGFDPVAGVQRNMTQMPIKSDLGQKPAKLCGVFLHVDSATGKTQKIETFQRLSSV